MNLKKLMLFVLLGLGTSAVLTAQTQPAPAPVQAGEGDVSVLSNENAKKGILTITHELVEEMVLGSFEYEKALITMKTVKRNRDGNVWNWLLPNVDGKLAFGTGGDKEGFDYAKDNNITDTWGTSIGLEMQLEISAWASMQILQAIEDFNSGKISFEQSKAKIYNNALVSFYGVIESENKIKASLSTVNANRETYTSAQGRYRSGTTDKIDMLQSRMNYQKAQDDYEQLLADHKKLVDDFRQLIGINLEQPVEFKGEINVDKTAFNGDVLAAEYLGKAYDVAKSQADFKSLQWQTVNAHSALLNPYMGLYYNPSYGNMPDTYDSANATSNNAWGYDYQASFEIGIKISFDSMLPWSKSGLDMGKMRDQLKIEEKQLRETRIATQISIINYADYLNYWQKSIQTKNDNVDLSAESLRLTRVGYNQGMKSLDDLQTAIKDNDSATTDLITAKMAYFTVLSDLSSTIGVPIEELIERNKI